jgi:hypothetical protein
MLYHGTGSHPRSSLLPILGVPLNAEWEKWGTWCGGWTYDKPISCAFTYHKQLLNLALYGWLTITSSTAMLCTHMCLQASATHTRTCCCCSDGVITDVIPLNSGVHISQKSALKSYLTLHRSQISLDSAGVWDDSNSLCLPSKKRRAAVKAGFP